ncbi:MAG: pectinesterase family protein [Treponema sp.]|nr:pectinesterase family protein [Treponema sp.]
MIELHVSSKSPAAITSAIKKIKEMSSTGAISKTSVVHLILEKGVYMETVKYNLANPLVMESAPGTPADSCVIQADNCDSYNKGQGYRSIFVLGPNCRNVTLKNFTIRNTHNRIVETGDDTPDLGESFLWNNTQGVLNCLNLKIEGNRNAVYLKGTSSFINSTIAGDSDYITGEVQTAYFENCTLYTKGCMRPDVVPSVVNSHALKDAKGFVFSSCAFTGNVKKDRDCFVVKTDGKGTESSDKDWDSVALLNCTYDENYSPELIWDDDMSLEAYPRGNAQTGVREYNPRTRNSDGSVVASDTGRRNVRAYTLTDDDYYQNYATRFLVFRGTQFESAGM